MPQVPFVVIPGFMKCGSTTIHGWLEEQPEFACGAPKEPNVLAQTSPGVDQAKLLELLRADEGLTIDASVSYLDPESREHFVRHLMNLNPDARILIAVRDPIERAISHVRHSIRRGRVHITSPSEYAALIAEGSIYVERSRYATAIAPLLDAVDHSQVAVIPTSCDDEAKWRVICSHLGLSERDLPIARNENRSSQLQSYTPAMRFLVDHRLVGSTPGAAPAWTRRVVRRVLLRSPVAAVATAEVASYLPKEIVEDLYDEMSRFRSSTVACRWPNAPDEESAKM